MTPHRDHLMAKYLGVPFYAVFLNGRIFRRGFMGEAGKRNADAMAERWQGSHSGGRGLLKHKDRGDYVEVKRDYAMEQDYAERVDRAQRGHPQQVVVQYNTEEV